MSREDQARFAVSDEDDARGDALTRCAAALQYSLPGIPVIYYGDEAGLHGLLDPFNRGTLPAEVFEGDAGSDVDGAGDVSLVDWYRRLGALRSARRALRTGGALYYSTNGDVIGVLRYCLGGRDAFGAPAADEMLFTVVNPDPEPRRIVIDLRAEKECLSFENLALIRALEPRRAMRLLSSCGGDFSPGDQTAGLPPCDHAGDISPGSPQGQPSVTPPSDQTAGLPPCDRTADIDIPPYGRRTVPITSGLLDISVPPLCAEIFEISWGSAD
jgi:hypothetical protein